MELMEFPQIKSIAIIAEGVPERVSFRLFGPSLLFHTDIASVPEKSSTLPSRRASPSLAPLPSVESSPDRSRSVTLVV